jgi:tetratricopeptide (TPR) repeat protein
LQVLQVRPVSWVAALLVSARVELGSAVLWAGTIIVSTLLHELTRRLAARSLRTLADRWIGVPLLPLAGPLASVTCGVVLVCLRPFVAQPEAHWLTVGLAFNFAWASIRLLPISGFDGGHLVEAWIGTRSSAYALLASIFTTELAAALAVVLLRSPSLGALLVAQGTVAMLGWIQRRRRLHEDQAGEPILRADQLLDAGRYADARESLRRVLSWECGSAARNAALHLQARIALRQREFDEAWEALQRVRPESAIDRYILAIVESARGRRPEAIAALTRASAVALSQEAARLLVDLHALGGDLRGAAAAATDNRGVLGEHDLRRVADVLVEAGESELAVGLLRSSMGLSRLAPGRLEEPQLSSVTAFGGRGTR